MLPDWLLGVSCYAATLLRRNGDFSSGAHRIARRLENLHHDQVVLQRAQPQRRELDRKSTRLNSSHLGLSYAVFSLKKEVHAELLLERGNAAVLVASVRPCPGWY